MASELDSMIRASHEGWQVAVRNARLIEDGQGSVISKCLQKSPEKVNCSHKKNEIKLPQLVPKHNDDNSPRQRIYQRNNPHPRIAFPFQTGDRLKTYMVWNAHTGMDPPPFLREKFPPRPKLKQSTNALNEGYKTVYQLEISEMPARMRYGVDAINYQPPELIKHSPYATKYPWATAGFMRDHLPSFRHYDVPPVPSYHEAEAK